MNYAVATSTPPLREDPCFQAPDEPLRYALLHVLNALPIPGGLVVPPSKRLSLYIERENRAGRAGRAGYLFFPTIEERALEALASSCRTPRGWEPPGGRVINKGVIREGSVLPDENPLFGLAVAGILRRRGLYADVRGFLNNELYGVAGRLDTAYSVNLKKLLGNPFLSYCIALIDSIDSIDSSYGAEELYASAARNEPPPATPALFHKTGDGLVYVVENVGGSELVRSYKNGFELTSDEKNGVLPFSNIRASQSFRSSQNPGSFSNPSFLLNSPTFYFSGSREALLEMIEEEGWTIHNPSRLPASTPASSAVKRSLADHCTRASPPPS